ncbi:hypothetical protein H9L21_15070 [Aeromicrobium senzhongii]|uniref:Transposase n=1 Tax=Aeromicrobium senzhongii TaxID=2663859 RepID=A0ABX6SUH1_9ACTN|nr:hypothetical protein [Aeromicrobium senzhongii]MTB89491.1 hypothetical protein [Aeromicrobium senzhongii]QNL94375.1 hypothetical protein H9L21_15070 [Aeromicrobium senzhongii]
MKRVIALENQVAALRDKVAELQAELAEARAPQNLPPSTPSGRSPRGGVTDLRHPATCGTQDLPSDSR